MSPKKNNGCGGFTLLELLIALTLFSVVIVIVGSVFGTGIFAWKRGEGEMGFYQELRLTFDRMAIEIRNILPYENAPFTGEKNSFSFVELRPSRSSSSPEWIQVTYEVKKTGTAPVLVRRTRPLSKEEADEEVLLSSFSELEFYYFAKELEGEWHWTEKWDYEKFKGPPPFVRMVFVMEGGEEWEKIFWVPTGVTEEEAPKEKEEEGESEKT